MTFSYQTTNRIIAFINHFAARCKECLFRSTINCSDCSSRWANSILNDLKNDNSSNNVKTIDYSMSSRFDIILNILKSSTTPLSADEIKLPSGICTKQLKYWTLKKMTRKNMIAYEKINGTCYYFIKKGNLKK